MAKRLGVLVIHGMGDTEPGYAEGLVRRLKTRLDSQAGDVEFEACFWAPILQNAQNKVWRRVQESGSVDAKGARQWVMSALGDPATYLSGYFKGPDAVYTQIHECVRSSLEKLETRLRNADRKPLVVLAHSLGSVIVSNYVWDEQHNAKVGKTAFERMETLTGFITYGSNIPLFVPPVAKLVNIKFPGPTLPPKLIPVARWENIYDPDDILGYPFNKIWDDPNGTTIDDIAINAGMWPLSELPLAHTAYNRDDDFLDIVEKRLKTILAMA